MISVFLFSVVHVANADCLEDAATYHAVNPWVLRAIVQIESSFNPNALHVNKNKTVDIGLTGTNAVHFPKLSEFGIASNDLLDPCISVYTGAWLLRKKIDKYGNTWTAVGAYNSDNRKEPQNGNIYAAKVRTLIEKWQRLGIIN